MQLKRWMIQALLLRYYQGTKVCHGGFGLEKGHRRTGECSFYLCGWVEWVNLDRDSRVVGLVTKDYMYGYMGSLNTWLGNEAFVLPVGRTSTHLGIANRRQRRHPKPPRRSAAFRPIDGLVQPSRQCNDAKIDLKKEEVDGTSSYFKAKNLSSHF